MGSPDKKDITVKDRLKKIRKDLDEAITYGAFVEARKLSTEGFTAAREWEYLGEMEYFKGQDAILDEDFAAAIGHFDRAIHHNPKDGGAYNDRALCMVELGMLDDAFSYLNKGIEVEPDYATVYHNKGWLLNRLERHVEAIEYFNKALRLEPDRAVTYENLGDSLARLGKYEEALKAYRMSVNLLKSEYSDIKKQLDSQIRKIEKRVRPEKSQGPG